MYHIRTSIIITRALLRLERTMNLFGGEGSGGEGRGGEGRGGEGRGGVGVGRVEGRGGEGGGEGRGYHTI